jgi:hypothetical protein
VLRCKAATSRRRRQTWRSVWSGRVAWIPNVSWRISAATKSSIRYTSNLRPSRRRLLLAHIAVFEPIRLAIIIDGKLEQALSKFSIEDFTGKLAKSRCLFP